MLVGVEFRSGLRKHRKEMKISWYPFVLSLAKPVSSFSGLGPHRLTGLKVVIKLTLYTRAFIVQELCYNFFFQVKVILEKSDKFDILMASNEINATGHQQTIVVPSEDGATVLFPVKPTRVGEIPITVAAFSPAASDAVTQRVLVKVNIWSLQ